MDQTISKGFVFLENAPELMRLLEDIFTDDFMQEYTRFESFEGFRYSSAVMVNWKADTLIYAPPLLDAFVKESTDFATWDEMVRTATGLRYTDNACPRLFSTACETPPGLYRTTLRNAEP